MSDTGLKTQLDFDKSIVSLLQEMVKKIQEQKQSFCEISTDVDGNCLVKVGDPEVSGAIHSYHSAIEKLKEIGFKVTNEKNNEVKVSNDNTRQVPTVTVKGMKGVTEEYLAERSKLEK